MKLGLLRAFLLMSAGAVAAVVPLGVVGQSLRDPTEPPAALGVPDGRAAAAVPGQTDPGTMAIVVRDGTPYVVVGTRLYAQGQKIGQARIERITETEVWFREGAVLRKQPIFSGIQRRPTSPKPL